MSVAGMMADAFYTEVLESGLVFTVRDEGGFPAPMTSAGVRAMPFWSKRSRAQKVIEDVPAYASFDVVEMTRDEWNAKWLELLARDHQLVGLNWSGATATGFDFSVADVRRALEERAGLKE